MINIQQTVKNNASDIQTYVHDMDDFFSDMKVKDKNPEKRVKTNLSKKAKAAMANVPLPPIRNKVEIEK